MVTGTSTGCACVGVWLVADDSISGSRPTASLSLLNEWISSYPNVRLRLSKYVASATLPPYVEDLCTSFMLNPITVNVGVKNSPSPDVEQSLVYVGNEEGKVVALKNLFYSGLSPPILLFVQSTNAVTINVIRVTVL